MIQQRNNIVWHKLNALLRYGLVHSLSGPMPFFIVNEFPKSGGSWMAQMLAEALAVPFPRNRLPMLRSSVIHGHFRHSWNMHNILNVWRDGRDVMTSYYYHSLFQNEIGNALLVEKVTESLDIQEPSDVKTNMPKFIDYCFSGRHPFGQWHNFVSAWQGKNDTVNISYEALRMDTTAELARVVQELTGKNFPAAKASEIADKFSFERQTKSRSPGQVKHNSFLRKGIVGDWKNCFNKEAREIFAHHAGQALIALGYEQDFSWV